MKWTKTGARLQVGSAQRTRGFTAVLDQSFFFVSLAYARVSIPSTNTPRYAYPGSIRSGLLQKLVVPWQWKKK
jgi:hypothetical protein